MRNTLTIAQRELGEKRFVFLTAAAFSLLAVVMPFLRGTSNKSDLVAVLSFIFTAGFSIAVALIIGATMVGRELSEGRLSFYFTKPVSAKSIWFGKLLAAVLVIAGCLAILAAPMVFANRVSVQTWVPEVWKAIGILFLAAIAMVLVAHVISTFVRSRSAWLVFDFVAAAVCAAVMWKLALWLLAGAAVELIRTISIALGAFAAVAVIASGAWQLERGRTDRKRSHIELSRFLWAAFGCGLLVVAAFVSWVKALSPADVNVQYAAQSAGPWAFVEGPGKNRADYRASFLYDINSGRAIRIQGLLPWWGSAFTPDGKTAFWMTVSENARQLWTERLDVAGAEPQETRVVVKHLVAYNISPDGSRFAAINPDRVLSIYDVASGNLLGSTRVGNGSYSYVFFPQRDVVRVYVHGRNPETTLISEYDIRSKKLTQTGEMPGPPFGMNASRTAFAQVTNGAVEIRDVRSGAVLRTIGGRFTRARFLRDGRIAAVDPDGLHIIGSDGASLRTVALPKERVLSLSDTGSGSVVVVLPKGRVVVVNIDRGAIVRDEKNLVPLSPGSAAPVLLCMSNDRLVAWNPATGEKRPV